MKVKEIQERYQKGMKERRKDSLYLPNPRQRAGCDIDQF